MYILFSAHIYYCVAVYIGDADAMLSDIWNLESVTIICPLTESNVNKSYL